RREERPSTDSVLRRLRARGVLLEECPRLLDLGELHLVAAEEEVVVPAPQHAPLALPRRHRKAVVAAVGDPGEEAGQGELARLERTVADAEAGDGAEVLVEVVDRLLATNDG